jgi:hypothetical protein
MNPFVARHLLAKIKKVNMKEEKEIIVTWAGPSDAMTPRANYSSSSWGVLFAYDVRRSLLQTPLCSDVEKGNNRIQSRKSE